MQSLSSRLTTCRIKNAVDSSYEDTHVKTGAGIDTGASHAFGRFVGCLSGNESQSRSDLLGLAIREVQAHASVD
jgi:hypothetical protein